MSNTYLPDITTDDFDLRPTKLSIARVYLQHLSRIATCNYDITHEDLYEQIEQRHVDLFNASFPFSNYDSFRKYISRHRRELYS